MTSTTWTTFHRRDDVLRDVMRDIDSRRDGSVPMDLPMDLPGVRETYGDELGVLAALQLRWHTRLSGHLERVLARESMDVDSAVADAWHATADELPGTRRLLDRYRAEPVDDTMARALATAAAKEHVLMAAMSGRAGRSTTETAAVGRQLEEQARRTYVSRVAA